MKLFQSIEISDPSKKKRTKARRAWRNIISSDIRTYHHSKFYKSSRFSNLSKLSINNASAGKKKRIASLTPLVPDFFLFSRPFNPREVSREIRSLIFHGPRLHANNAIKRFEYRPDNALSTASSQPFLPFFFLARSFTICMESQPPRPSLFIEGREGLASLVNSVTGN